MRHFLAAHPHVHFHFTPTYTSWLNQVEIWFSKIERDVIARGVFTLVNDLARKLRRYINAYSANAQTDSLEILGSNSPRFPGFCRLYGHAILDPQRAVSVLIAQFYNSSNYHRRKTKERYSVIEFGP